MTNNDPDTALRLDPGNGVAASDNGFLTADEILAMQDIDLCELVIPEWNNRKVLVKPLSGTDRDRYESSLRKVNLATGEVTSNAENARAKLVALCLIKPDGTKLFTPMQIEALGAKSSAALNRIFEFAAEKSGISKRDRKSLETEAKNDQAITTGVSNTA